VLKKQMVPGSHKSNFPMPQELSYMEEMTDMIHNPSAEVRENGIFEPFIHKNEHFAKTGSGQT
jgi:hypothetical protein